MALKLFKPVRFAKREGNPILTVSSNGVISFNKKACSVFDLPKNRIDFHQDVDNPLDWYITLGPDKTTGLRKLGKSGTFGFNSTKLVKELTDNIDSTERSVQFLLSTKPSTDLELEGAYAIITSYRKKTNGEERF